MATTDPLLGKQLGDYKIEDLIGHGGMARVYRGYDEKLDRYAAVKVIEPTLIAGGEEEEYRDRFLREARSIARLSHPNIVGVYQFAQEENHYFIAMAYLDGRDLREVLKEDALEGKVMPRERMVTILHNIANGLDYAHKNNIIHRDVKPSNIIVTNEGNAVLTDFGLALNAVEGTIGNTFGSVHYIAPEQAISSAQAVPQSDQYSLGIIVYELLAGQVPFDDASAMSVALKHISDPPPPIRDLNSKVTPELEAVVMRALDKEPNNRFATVADFIKELDKALQDAPDALVGASPAERTTDLPPVSPSMDDDAPTLPDTGSRPDAIGSVIPSTTSAKTKVPGEAGGGINMTVAVVAIVVIVALAVAGLLISNNAAASAAATETAIAQSENSTGTAVIVAQNATSTEDANLNNTATAEFSASETAIAIANDNATSTAETDATNDASTQVAIDNTTSTAEFEATETAIGYDNATSTANFENTQDANDTATAEAESTNDAATESAQEEATETQSAIQTQQALVSPTPTSTSTLRPSATHTPSPTFTATATSTPSPVPTTIPLVAGEDEEELLLRYDGRTVLITNRSSEGSIFINNLVFIKYVENEEGELETADRFRMTNFSDAPFSLRPDSCLQLWDNSQFSRPSTSNRLADDSCIGIPIWRTVNDIFWIDNDSDSYFEITISGVDLLATCPISRSRTTVEQRCVAAIP